MAVLAFALAFVALATSEPAARSAAAGASRAAAATCPADAPSPEPSPIGIGSSAWLVTAGVSSGMRRFFGSTFYARADGTVWRDGCVAHLGTTDLKSLANAVAQTYEVRWAPSYGHAACCDQQSFSVDVARTSKGKTRSHGATASSATYANAPPDWQHLYETLEAVTHRYGAMARHDALRHERSPRP